MSGVISTNTFIYGILFCNLIKHLFDLHAAYEVQGQINSLDRQ